MFNDMRDIARSAMQRGNSYLPIPSPFGNSLKIPMAALDRLRNPQAYNNTPSANNLRRVLTGFRDYENKTQGFENLPYMRPATGSYVPSWGTVNAVTRPSLPAVTRPFLPGTGGGYNEPPVAVTPDITNYLKGLNSLLGR